MCGRYALHLRAGEVRAQVESQTGRHVGAWEDESDYNPDRGYNIPPRSRNPVILRGGGGAGDIYDEPSTGERKDDQTNSDSPQKVASNDLRIECMQWGLVPHWMKRQPDHASSLKTINARDDTIVEGGSMWKSIRGRRRCVVVAEGFYEWLKKGNDRVPHHVKRKDGKLFCFAGLWDTVTYEGETKPLRTYTIVTTNSNKQLNFLHDRMPVVLDGPKDIETWLDTSSGDWSKEAADLLKPFEGELECYIVPKEVGKVGNQSPDFLKPIAERKGNISSFFAKSTSSTASEKKVIPKSPPVSAGMSSKPDKQSSGDEPAKAKRSQDDAVEVVKEQDLALNPDEADKVQTRSSSRKLSNEPAGKESKPIVLDEEESIKAKPKRGKQSEPIVLDDESDEDKPTPRSNIKRKRQADSIAAPKNSPDKKARKAAEQDTEGKGNEKLTSFFETVDDA